MCEGAHKKMFLDQDNLNFDIDETQNMVPNRN